MSPEVETSVNTELKGSDLLPHAIEQSDAAMTLWLLLTGWHIIARFAFAGLLLGLVLAFALPTKYKSTAELMPPDNHISGISELANNVAGSGLLGGLIGAKPSGDLFVGVLQSETVLDNVIDKFDLRKVYRTKYYERARKKLADSTEISEDRKSGIINITVIDKDPQRAAAIADQYVTALNRLVTALDTSSAHRERIFLEDRLKLVRQDLVSAETALGQFSSENATLDLTNQGKATLEAIGSLQGELIAARADLDGLQKIYGPENARVKSAQARVSELQRELQKLGGSSPESTADSPSSAALYPSLRQLPLLGVTYADLYRRATLQEALYETLTKQYELARVEEAKELPAVKVLDAPLVPERKFSPPRGAIILLTILLSAAIGIVWILGRKRWAELPLNSSWKVLLGNIRARDTSALHALFNAARERALG